MSGKTMNIYLKSNVFELLDKEIGKGRISSFINETIMERLLKIQELKKLEEKKKIINYYQKISSDKEIKDELSNYEDLSLESLKKNASK